MEVVEQQHGNDHPMEKDKPVGKNCESDQEQLTRTEQNRPSKCNDKQQQLLRDFERAIKETNRAHTLLQNAIEELYKGIELYAADSSSMRRNDHGKSNNRHMERSCHMKSRDNRNYKCNCVVSDSNASDSDLDYAYWEHHPRHMRWKCHQYGRHSNSRHHHGRSHSRN